jgi:hypothetical protein
MMESIPSPPRRRKQRKGYAVGFQELQITISAMEKSQGR